ncbi:hypothetical protein GCK32_013590 [Trichostrongylus colubriformis]|uniref:Uncharacterized protein n=1 Tax=Trichostrongylus colubriformis TaxID=6319 RepID=A0AAN8ILR2_TRICO
MRKRKSGTSLRHDLHAAIKLLWIKRSQSSVFGRRGPRPILKRIALRKSPTKKLPKHNLVRFRVHSTRNRTKRPLHHVVKKETMSSS